MKTKRLLSAASIALLGMPLFSTNVFAANPYGITYSDGTELNESTVTIDPELIEGLSPLIQTVNTDENFSNAFYGSKWQTAYMKDSGVCFEMRYLLMTSAGFDGSDGRTGITFTNGQYTIDARINKIVTENVDDTKGKIIAGAPINNGFIYAGNVPFTSLAECEKESGGEKVADIQSLDRETLSRAFVDMTVSLYKNKDNSKVIANGLYFGITDIDAAQSFKIMNQGNFFEKSNMFAKSVADLQNENDNGLKNMYSPTGSYIYSEYNKDGAVSSSNKANVYVSVKKETQEEGLNVVFGYGSTAGSTVEYYAKQYLVTYASDENGKIAPNDGEKVIAGENPSVNVEVTPNEGYEFIHWITDVDVTLNDGTTIKAGEPITTEQARQVVVDQDLEFTAINETLEPEEEDEEEGGVIAVPDTGASTKDINAILIPASIFGILVGALIIRALPRLLHKKVNFNK